MKDFPLKILQSSNQKVYQYQLNILQALYSYIMPEEYSIDIDTPFDWMIAEFLMESLS